MKSDTILESFKADFARVCALPSKTKPKKVKFLRAYLSLLNAFLYEWRPEGEIEQLNNPDKKHPEWMRITPFLAIWDDYAKAILGFTFDQKQVEKLAAFFVGLFQASGRTQKQPATLESGKRYKQLGGLTPRQFALIRIMHALQDFSEVLPPIDVSLVSKIKAHMPGRAFPDEVMLKDEVNAARLLVAFGGADRNVDERKRYIYGAARILANPPGGTAYAIAETAGNDVRRVFKKLTDLPGLKGKKANMILRDFYSLGIWRYDRNIETIEIIPDNRVMRVALRTGVIRPAMGKLLNSLLDEFDFQYVLATGATQEAFRRVWEATRKPNGGSPIVPFPAGMDEFVFKLGDGRGGCCKPNAPSCLSLRRPKKFAAWLESSFKHKDYEMCPLEGICPKDTRKLQAPFAVQNNTWMEIFTGAGGGGGLRGA